MENTNKENQKKTFSSMRAAVFDMDGTLIDSIPMWETAGIRYLKTMGITAEPDFWVKTREMDMNLCAEYIQSYYSVKKSVQEIKDGIINRVIYRGYTESVPLKPGAGELLSRLQTAGIPIILATATDRICIEACFKRLNILHFFTRIFTCSEVGKTKSDPDIFLLAAQAAEAVPEHTVVFEDSYYAVSTAKKAGFKVCAVYDHSADENGDWEKMKSDSDCWCRSLLEL